MFPGENNLARVYRTRPLVPAKADPELELDARFRGHERSIWRLRRLLLPLGREARIKALAPGGHLDEQLVRLEALAVFLRELFAQRDELTCAHHVDVGQRAARIGRVAEAEDRADVGFAHVGEHALLEAARGLQRLDREQASFQFVYVDYVGVLLGRLQVSEARP